MSPQAKSWKMLPLARRYSCCLCLQTVLSPVILHRLFLWWFRLSKIIRNAAQRINCCCCPTKCSLSLNCYWLCRQDPVFSYLACFSIFFPSWWEPLSHLQQQTTLRYQQLLVKPFPFSTLLQCPYPPSVPPQGVLERSTLWWPRGEKMAEFIPRCVADNTPMCRTSRYRLHTADFPPGVSPHLQHRH